MYEPLDKIQNSFFDFNQPLGMHMNPKNRWGELADRIPWDDFEENTQKCFPVIPEMLRKRLTHEIIMETNEYMLDH